MCSTYIIERALNLKGSRCAEDIESQGIEKQDLI